MRNEPDGRGIKHVAIDDHTIRTTRISLRPWRPDDALTAYQIYGTPEVFRWLTPAMPPPTDATSMTQTLDHWIAQGPTLEPPQGRWAIVLNEGSAVVGGATLLSLPPGHEDIEMGWQLAPTAWGKGIAAEAGHALAHYAFSTADPGELFAVARPGNKRGIAAARRVGMEWVGRTEKYYGLSLEAYRLRKDDLAAADDLSERYTGSDQVTYRRNDDVGAYEAITDAQVVGSLDYRRRATHTVITHTVVAPAYRGRGIASGLITYALNDLLSDHGTVTNYCPFVDDYVAAHPKYQALMSHGYPTDHA